MEQERGNGQSRAHGTRLLLVAREKPLELVFEPWANEFVVPAGESVLVEFGADDWPVEAVHGADGITFYSGGLHPDVFSRDGDPLLVLSDVMPVPVWPETGVVPPVEPRRTVPSAPTA
ncbi:hypothetical protein ACWGB8_28985 [Kitasatospora sp. NPDC054939]